MQKFRNLELNTFYSINSINSRFLDVFLRYITNFGHPVFWICIEIISMYLGYYDLASYIGIGLGIDAIIIVSLQLSIRRKRPFKIIEKEKIIVRRFESTPSFPSAHTARSFYMITILTMMWWEFSFIFFVISAFVAISRIYLGVHFPTDTIGGAAIGITSAVFSALFLQFLFIQFTDLTKNLLGDASTLWKILFLIISISGILFFTLFYEKKKKKNT